MGYVYVTYIADLQYCKCAVCIVPVFFCSSEAFRLCIGNSALCILPLKIIFRNEILQWRRYSYRAKKTKKNFSDAHFFLFDCKTEAAMTYQIKVFLI